MERAEYVGIIAYSAYAIFVLYFIPIAAYYNLLNEQQIWISLAIIVIVAILTFVPLYKISQKEIENIARQKVIYEPKNFKYSFLSTTTGEVAFLMLINILLIVIIHIFFLFILPPQSSRGFIAGLFMYSLIVFMIFIMLSAKPPIFLIFEDKIFIPQSIYDILKGKSEFIKYDDITKIENTLGFYTTDTITYGLSIYTHKERYSIPSSEVDELQKVKSILRTLLGENKWNKVYFPTIAVDWRSLKSLLEFYKYDEKFFNNIWKGYFYYFFGVIVVSIFSVIYFNLDYHLIIIIDYVLLGPPPLFVFIFKYKSPRQEYIRKCIKTVKDKIDEGLIDKNTVPDWFKKYIEISL